MLVREQLPDNTGQRVAAITAIREVLSASAAISGEVAKQLQRLAEPIGVKAEEGRDSNVAPFDPKSKAS